MSYTRHLESDRYDQHYNEAKIGGTGSVSTLYMTEEEMQAVEKKPLGFTAELPKPKRRRKTK